MSMVRIFTLAAWGVGLAALAAPVPSAKGADGQGCRPRYFIDPQLTNELTGVYDLSDGELLRVSRAVSRYYADMPSTGRIEIVPVDHDVFVQRDGPVRLAFERDAFTTGVTVTGLDGRPSGPALCRK